MGKRTDAIVMASGFSSRFGAGDKLLCPFRGEPLVLRTVRLLRGMNAFSTLRVVYANPAVAACLAGELVSLVFNPHPERGQRESIRLGVEASEADAFLFVPCDQPLLDGDTIERLLSAGGEGRIVAPTHRGRGGAPVLFSATFRQELSTLKPGETGKTICQRHPAATVQVEVFNGLALEDVDTLEDLRRLEGL